MPLTGIHIDEADPDGIGSPVDHVDPPDELRAVAGGHHAHHVTGPGARHGKLHRSTVICFCSIPAQELKQERRRLITELDIPSLGGAILPRSITAGAFPCIKQLCVQPQLLGRRHKRSIQAAEGGPTAAGDGQVQGIGRSQGRGPAA